MQLIGGLLFAKSAFSLIDKKIKFNVKKKMDLLLKKGSLVAIIQGNAQNILIAERVALNFLSHISGIATKTNKFVKLAGKKMQNMLHKKNYSKFKSYSKICCQIRWWN